MTAPMSDERLAEIRHNAWRGLRAQGDLDELLAEVGRLREGLAAEQTRRMRAEVDLLLARKKRDEAQREVCVIVAEACEGLPNIPPGPEAVATWRGWDCYPKGEG